MLGGEVKGPGSEAKWEAFTQAGPELMLDARDTEMNTMWSPMGKTEKIQAKVCQRETAGQRALYFAHGTFLRSSQTK